MDIEHPAAKMMVEVAKTQDSEVGDGTTTAVVLAGELLKQAGILFERNVHPSSIVKGYNMASEKAQQLIEGMAVKVSEKDTDMLRKIAGTSVTGKDCEGARDFLADMVVRAALKVLEKDDGGKFFVEKKNLVLEKKTGGQVTESEILDGVLVDKGRVDFRMPEKLQNVKVLAMDIGIEAKDTKFDAEYKIKQPGQFRAFQEEEQREIKSQVDKIASLGVKAVFTTKAIDDLAHHYMAQKGIMGVRRLKTSDVNRIAKATGGTLITNLNDATEKEVGIAGLIEEKKVGKDEMIFISKCKYNKIISVVLRGATSHVLDEYERGVDDALHAVETSVKDGKIVAGGAAVETELSMKLRKYASEVKGKEQLAIQAYAEAFEALPKALASNAGLNPIDMMIELKNKHEGKDGKYYGLDVYQGKAVDMLKAGVVEPMRIKTQAIISATEAATMILRIDDVLAASQVRAPPGMPGMN
jgi:thermosome